jgi:hypothetical protein
MKPLSDRTLIAAEIALISALVLVLVAALTIAIVRPTTVTFAAATSIPSGESPPATPSSTPTPAPTVTVHSAPSTAVQITNFSISPDPVDCTTDPGDPRPLDMHWASVNGAKASITVNSLVIASNLPASGGDSDLPASAQPLAYSCQAPYWVFKLTVVKGASTATETVTVVARTN